MRRTMFEAGFSSPTHSYQIQHPQMGSLWSDIKDLVRGTRSSSTTPPPPPPPPAPQPTGTVLGIPTQYVVIGGAVALALGIVAAIVGSRKASGPPPVPPKPGVGRRRR